MTLRRGVLPPGARGVVVNFWTTPPTYVDFGSAGWIKPLESAW
jgi:hypothetical protein